MSDTIAPPELVHCIYSSAEAVEFSQEEIFELLDIARTNNAKVGVTGMLLYERGSFFQVLEGERAAVDSVLAKIEKDERHNQVVKIIYEVIEERDFAEWTMGYSGVSVQELKNVEGLNDFFRSELPYTRLDEGRTKKLLKAFKEGQWRASIS